MELKDIVRETFYTIIDTYNAELKSIDENKVQVIAENFLIDVKWHFGEVFVRIKESEVDEGIEPLLWGYFTSQLDYKNVFPPSYPPEMRLGEIAKNSLFIECTCIRLFCKNLLDGDFSRKLEFYNRKKSIMVEINASFMKKFKDN